MLTLLLQNNKVVLDVGISLLEKAWINLKVLLFLCRDSFLINTQNSRNLLYLLQFQDSLDNPAYCSTEALIPLLHVYQSLLCDPPSILSIQGRYLGSHLIH